MQNIKESQIKEVKKFNETTTVKVYHVQKSMSNYSNFISNRILVEIMENADLVFFEGGEDVGPILYDESEHPLTFSNRKRDSYELEQFKKAQALGIKMFGTCRGSQFLCIMAGGRLIQHQDNPTHYHEIFTNDGREIRVNSLHHQAQFPFDMVVRNRDGIHDDLGFHYNTEDIDCQILGWAEDHSAYHEDGNQKEMHPPVEVEVAYYPKIQALCIQGHPELMPNSEFAQYTKELLYKHLNNEL